MKNRWLALLPMLLAACSIETSDNGPLDGFWHLEQVDTLATGGSNMLQEQRLFWAFQHKLMSMSDKDGAHQEVVMRFEWSADSLRLWAPYVSDREVGDVQVSDAVLLQPYGVQTLTDGFAVETLSGSKLVLRGKTLRLRLRKF